MRAFINLGFAASLAALTIAHMTLHRHIKDLNIKRSYLTCAETYGGGSTTCGNISSHYCYDPTIGESCCPLDDGYCEAGYFCALEAGYCCHNGEDPAICASRLSFTLPPSFSTTTLSTSTATVEILAVDVPSASSTGTGAPVTAATSGVLGAQVLSTTSAGAMMPDFTAIINQTPPSATVSAVLGTEIMQFTGGARRVDLGMGIGGLLGIAVAAGLVP